MTTADSIRDIIIVGGGPAGLTAGLYASRARLDSLLIERGVIGGQITNAELVENFPGFPDGISGYDLGQLLHQQATKYGLETVFADVTAIELQEELKLVKTTEGDFASRALILAGGSSHRQLGVPGETKFTGKGVSYCATCDAPFFQDRPVAVIGGGDAAVTEALHLAKFASSVSLVHRRSQLRAGKIMQERAFAEPKISYVWGSVVESIEGKDFVERVRLRNVQTGQTSSLEVAGVFISVGLQPATGYLRGLVPLSEAGHVITTDTMDTGVPGIFAAGDIRQNSARQAITAAGDGATAAIYARKYLRQ
jgi:thioredoxin reductase (NADPH)